MIVIEGLCCGPCSSSFLIQQNYHQHKQELENLVNVSIITDHVIRCCKTSLCDRGAIHIFYRSKRCKSIQSDGLYKLGYEV